MQLHNSLTSTYRDPKGAKERAESTNPNNDFVLQRVWKLVAGKKNIVVSVQLHAKNVADGVVFSFYGERRRIYNLRVSLVRDLLGAFGNDESLVAVRGIHGFSLLLLSLTIGIVCRSTSTNNEALMHLQG
uniref:DNA-directed RNA polymerases II IV and V subunit 11 n=1 Tax=Rhizophora mucronata TaxID=61149 RepID=A0A2P2JH19_RHIMU